MRTNGMYTRKGWFNVYYYRDDIPLGDLGHIWNTRIDADNHAGKGRIDCVMLSYLYPIFPPRKERG